MSAAPKSVSHVVILGVALVVGLAVRVGVLRQTSELAPKIFDEHHYSELATSLADGKGFSWATGEPTSLRPPLYPAMVAAIWTATGTRDYQVVRLVQILLSAVTAALVLELGRRAFNARVGVVAAAVTWLYPDLIFLNYLVLTETLFTFLVVAFVLLSVMLVQRPRGATALACGLALGLATLTRSILWPLPILLCPLLVLLLSGPFMRRLMFSALVLAGFVVVVTPWAVRNTRLQGTVTIVDTMGGMNLRMGNYEHTPESRMWDAVSVTGEQSWIHALAADQAAGLVPDVVTEGVKDKWAQRKALQYMRDNPGTTIRRALIKFADFWGLERSYLAGVQQGLYAPPAWFAFVAIALMLISYAAISLSAAGGIWLARPAWPAHLLLLLPVALITALHSIVFGHARYHLPLMPILSLYAAALWVRGPLDALRRQGWARTAAILTMLLLVAIWARQVLIVDGSRIRALVGGWW